MIIFNGISLKSVAPLKIEDIRISQIDLNPVTRARAIRFGSDFVRMSGGQRTVAVTFALLDQDKVRRHESLMRISQWAKTDKEYKLEFEIDPSRYLMCVCTSKPEPSMRQWWESKLRLVFTCFDNPFWTSNGLKTVSCGTAFTALGDAPPLMSIKRTLSEDVSTDQVYSNGEQTMIFTAMPAGNVTIDLNRQTASLDNGQSIMSYYKPTSKFLIPKIGTQTITGSGTVYFRERWQ